jgi:hypothetical protein
MAALREALAPVMQLQEILARQFPQADTEKQELKNEWSRERQKISRQAPGER